MSPARLKCPGNDDNSFSAGAAGFTGPGGDTHRGLRATVPIRDGPRSRGLRRPRPRLRPAGGRRRRRRSSSSISSSSGPCRCPGGHSHATTLHLPRQPLPLTREQDPSSLQKKCTHVPSMSPGQQPATMDHRCRYAGASQGAVRSRSRCSGTRSVAIISRTASWTSLVS
jgi:hypothetical protein